MEWFRERSRRYASMTTSDGGATGGGGDGDTGHERKNYSRQNVRDDEGMLVREPLGPSLNGDDERTRYDTNGFEGN